MYMDSQCLDYKNTANWTTASPFASLSHFLLHAHYSSATWSVWQSAHCSIAAAQTYRCVTCWIPSHHPDQFNTELLWYKGWWARNDKALDGHTHYKMLYNVKPGLGDLHVFNVLWPSEKLKKPIKCCTWTVDWATNISRVHVILCDARTQRNWFWSHYVVWPGCPLWVKLSNLKHISYCRWLVTQPPFALWPIEARHPCD